MSVDEHAARFVQHAVDMALRTERLEDRYRTSAEFHHRVDLLEQWLRFAVPLLPVAMSDVDLLLWVRRLVIQVDEHARDEELRIRLATEVMAYGTEPRMWPNYGEEQR